MIELVDTHTHLNDEKFDGQEKEVIERARAAGVTRLINMGDTLASSEKAVKLAETYDGVFAGVGIHPEEAIEMTAREKDPDKRQQQQRLFIRQLDLARQLHLPVCIHDREAHGDTMRILRQEGRGIRGVMHCFSGSWEMAQELLRIDWFIGVDGPLTFKNAAKLPDIVCAAPLDRILVETDAPYMTPVPLRGQQNEPAYVRYIAEKVAEIKGISLAEVAEQTSRNAEELYAL